MAYRFNTFLKQYVYVLCRTCENCHQYKSTEDMALRNLIFLQELFKDLSVSWYTLSSLFCLHSVLHIRFFSLKKDSRTRGHEVKLAKDQYRLDIRKYSFSRRTINEWNKLSMDCITASSVNMFKNKVDTYLRRAGYT